MEHALRALPDRGRVPPASDALALGLHADELHVAIAGERVEDPDRVRAAADAGHHRVRELAEPLEELRAGLGADDRLEVAHDGRVGVRSGGRAHAVVGGLDVRHPVAHRLVHRVLERARAGGHGAHLGAEQLHALHVRRLAAHVLGAHVDLAAQAEERARRRGRHAVLAGAGLGDHPRLAHPLGEQHLADGVVHLVRAGVAEILALEPHARADLGREARREVDRRRPAHVVAQQIEAPLLECGVGAGLRVGGLERVERRHEGLGHVAAAVATEEAGGGQRHGRAFSAEGPAWKARGR